MFLSQLPSASCSGFIMVSIILVNTILVSTKPVTTILVTTILVHADKHTKHTCSQVCRHACICVFSECLYQSTINGCKPTTFLSPPSQTETGAATRQVAIASLPPFFYVTCTHYKRMMSDWSCTNGWNENGLSMQYVVSMPKARHCHPKTVVKRCPPNYHQATKKNSHQVPNAVVPLPTDHH